MCKKTSSAIIYVVVLITLLASTFGAVHAQQDFDVKLDNAILIDADSGQILFEKNAHERREPASLTKLMSTLLIMENLDNEVITLDDKVTISYRASKTEGSKIWLNQGEVYTVYDLLLATIVTSANDATVALAEYVAGTEGNFVRLMNRKADELGLKNTYFHNATGLPVQGEGVQYVSPYDVAVISRELLKYPEILEWSSKQAIQIRGEWRANTNKLFLQYFDGANGLKTGWTEEAKYSLSASATRGDMHLVTVVMGADSDEHRMEEASKLLDYGFRKYDTVTVSQKGIRVGSIRLLNGIPEEMEVVASRDLTVLVAKGRENKLRKEILLDENTKTPIAKGDTIGTLKVYDEDNYLGETAIQANEDVKKANVFTVMLRKIRNFFVGLFNQD